MVNFYNTYEILNQLNEDVLSEAGGLASSYTLGQIYGIDVTDQGNKFREHPLHNEKPLSDFIAVEETIKNNLFVGVAYDKDPKTWPLSKKISFVLAGKCKGCGKDLALKGQAIYDAKNRAKDSYDIERLCTLCSNCRNKLYTKSDETPQIITYSLGQVSQEATNVGQFKVRGFQKTEDPNKSLWAALLPLDQQPQETRNKYKATSEEDMKSWQAFCTNTKSKSPDFRYYAFKCPSCKQSFTMSNYQLYQRANGQSETKIPANLAWCSDCMTTEAHIHSQRQTSFMDTEYASWIDPQLFEDGLLTDNACKLILEKNKEDSKALKELNMLTALSDSGRTVEDNNQLKYAVLRQLPKSSDVRLKFICANKDCQRWCVDHKKKNSYWAKLVSVSNNVFHGCPNCLHRNNTGSSESERRLRKAVEYIFNVQHINNQTKIKPFNVIDILFEYDGKLVGIEYDGGYYHKDPLTIETDEKKVKAYSNVKFLRVRESACAPFNDELAACINITKPITNLTSEEFIDCLTSIGHRLVGPDFNLTAEQKQFISGDFYNK